MNKEEMCDKVVVHHGAVINLLCSLLHYADNSIKYEASWVLINLTNYSEKSEKFLYTENNINMIVEFFNYADEVLLEHAIWLLANISSDNQHNREFLLRQNIIEPVNKLLDSFSTNDIIKEKCIWLICNLCRSRMYPEYANYFIDSITLIIKFLDHTFCPKEIKHCLYSIYKLTSTTTNIIEIILSENIYRRLADLMFKYDDIIRFYVIKIIANLLSGSDVQTQRLINEGVINLYRQLLEEDDMKITKEVLWGLSNISAGTCSQIDSLHEAGILIKVLGIADCALSNIHKEDRIYKDVKNNMLFINLIRF
jgi:importin subunit alpha-1